MARRYLGPADTFVYGGTSYPAGSVVPITDHEALHHSMYGHRFEGMDIADPTATAPAIPIEPAADAKKGKD